MLDLHEESRRLETHLKEKVSGALGSRRGGSHDNTRYALSSISSLAEAVDDTTVLGILKSLSRWTRRAEAFFVPEKGLHRLPRQPKEKEARCPWCSYQTMRWHPSTGIVVCVNPHCVTDQDVRPRWCADFVVNDEGLEFSWREMETA